MGRFPDCEGGTDAGVRRVRVAWGQAMFGAQGERRVVVGYDGELLVDWGVGAVEARLD